MAEGRSSPNHRVSAAWQGRSSLGLAAQHKGGLQVNPPELVHSFD